MNASKVDELDYIHFLVAAQRVFTTTEAARIRAGELNAPAHDAYTRLLKRIPPDTEALWQEVAPFVQPDRGVLVVDDTTLDKPHARKMALVRRHWSGKHKRVVQGINLISLLWTEGQARLPCDFRLYNRAEDGLFRALLQTAHARGFQPRLVAFDSWYASLANLKYVRQLGWEWFTRLKANRLVSVEGERRNRPVSSWPIPAEGCVMHLKGYGWVKVFKTVTPNGREEYWATSRLDMTLEESAAYGRHAWQIEVYHQGLKQFTGIERGPFRVAEAQRNHIGLAIGAFLRLEVARLQRGISWFEAKQTILREAIRHYLASPSLILHSTT
ncbi:transposase IS4 family protein [Rhodothermus marinus SG0.5JP17-172]|uniref:IS701 family transposase n=1 Tax=Rhodothermus marinus TaxID=29549 RepID=UPI000223D8CC|nr:IS701 family transposase [Rhodothermus marinus]AEN73418.1 transposase IS4 family protein [Rhodothermus marinus SG0.5JP17-172]